MSQIDLNLYQIQPAAIRLIPEATARKYRAIPFAVEGSTLKVGMAETGNLIALQELAALARMRIEPVLANADDIRRAIDQSYSDCREIEKQFNSVEQIAEASQIPQLEDFSDAPVVRALDLIINEAVKVRSSDIHVEPQEDRVRVRFRIDGVLHDKMSLPVSAHAPLLSRIKVMAKMNIADHRPQDGQFSHRIRNQEVDVRVATVETIYGEMTSLRILDKAFAHRSLLQLGFSPASLQLYESMLKSPLGMILISGPTGSGKTTTLYASINSLDCIGRKMITIEDPIEYRFKNINQIQVNQKAGLTFASGLRSIMRHDPDVILVGEIRDRDTAAIATQSALTGQLVLSSVHANDAIGSLLRLYEMGISPYVIVATLIGVVSQRMVRRVCSHCSHLVPAPPEAQLAYFNELEDSKNEFHYGKGCNACAGTGYLGRVAVFEILVMNKQIRTAILAGAGADELRAIARKSGMVTMWRDGMLKVQANMTTPCEVMRKLYYVG